MLLSQHLRTKLYISDRCKFAEVWTSEGGAWYGFNG